MSDHHRNIANERVGWVMIFFAAIIAGAGFGGMMSVTVFLEPLENDFGWLRQETSFAYMVGNLAAGFGGILMGGWTDRSSARPVILTGVIVMGASFIALAMMRTRMEFYVIYGLILCGLGVSAFMVPLASTMGFWFDKNRGLAMSLMMGGQSLGGAFVPYLARYLIDTMSWQEAYLVMGLGCWLLLIPVCFIVRDPPGLGDLKALTKLHSADETAVRPLIATRPLVVLLSLAAQGCCICMAMPLVHLVPLLSGIGYAPQRAAGVLSVLMVASMVGRLIFGKVLDKLGGTRTLFIASGLQTISTFWFTQVDGIGAQYFFAVIFGLGFGGVFPAYTVIVSELVPVYQAGRSMGIVFFSAFIGMGLGGYFGGLFYDLTGDYQVSFGLAALAGVGNMIFVALLYLRLTRSKALLDTPVPQAA